MQPSRALRSSLGLTAVFALALMPSLGCKKDGGAGASGSAPSASGSASAIPSGSASAAPSGSAAADASGAASGNGVGELLPVASKPDCQAQPSELATYLQRGEIAIASRDNGVSTSWMVQAPGKQDAQVAFAGYDGQAKQVARIRGIGSAREHAPQVFSTAGEWTVTWFDSDGLAFTRPTWDKSVAPPLEHLPAVGKSLAEDVALAATPSGSLVAAAPFGAERNQLGLFLFAPVEAGAPSVQALGVSKHAVKPRRPAIAADESGYYAGWLGEGDVLTVSHFDMKGKESDPTVLAPGGPKRESLSLIPTASGALAVWVEDGSLIARPLSKQAQPNGGAVVVAKGARWPKVAPLREGALVVWVGKEGKADGQLYSVKLGLNGAPSEKGLLISDDGHFVKDPPAVAVTGGKAAFAWTEVMSSTVSTKRALLRTVEVACLP
jgi:hypothetical protein